MGYEDISADNEPARTVQFPTRPAPVRMRDIAAVAGVSQSTVSRVLNDAPTRVPIAAETRERVIAAAQQLGYRPNPLARGLRGASTMLIGAVVRDFSDPFFASAIEALAVEAMARGYNVVLGHAHGRVDEGIALTTVLETRHTDAIVMLGDMQDQPRLLDDLRNWHASRSSPCGRAPARSSSRRSTSTTGPASSPGLEHLVALGHERIAFVSARLPGDNRQRQDAFVEFMRDRFGGVPDGYLQRRANTLAGGEAALRALLALRGAADRGRDLDRPRRRRRPPCRLQPRRGPCPTSCPSSASTTSSWPRTPCRP